jgi:hypothetical protein
MYGTWVGLTFSMLLALLLVVALIFTPFTPILAVPVVLLVMVGAGIMLSVFKRTGRAPNRR